MSKTAPASLNEDEHDICSDLDTEQLARHYHDNSESQREVGQFVLQKGRITKGDWVLDDGTGTGHLAHDALDLVGPNGRVIAFDLEERRIAIALDELKKLGGRKPNIWFEVGDAHDLSRFVSDTFDVVYMNAVYHWLREPYLAVAEAFRVLKPRGRFVICTGCKDYPPPYQLIKTEALKELGYPEKGVEKLPEQTEFEEGLTKAGFAIEEVVFHSSVMTKVDPDAVMDWAEASMYGNFLNYLDEEKIAMARQHMRPKYEKFRTSKGIEITLKRMIAVVIKP